MKFAGGKGTAQLGRHESMKDGLYSENSEDSAEQSRKNTEKAATKRRDSESSADFQKRVTKEYMASLSKKAIFDSQDFLEMKSA